MHMSGWWGSLGDASPLGRFFASGASEKYGPLWERFGEHGWWHFESAAVSKLASLGTRGSCAQHIWRDLQKWLPKPKLPSLHYMFLPLYNSVLGRFSKSVPMILPHKLFPAIFHHYPIMFDKLVYGSRDHCRRFWKSVSNSEHFRSHS